jgi:hypothetical protein
MQRKLYLLSHAQYPFEVMAMSRSPIIPQYDLYQKGVQDDHDYVPIHPGGFNPQLRSTDKIRSPDQDRMMGMDRYESAPLLPTRPFT